MIVFDLQALQSDSFGGRGIGRYVLDLATTLASEHRGVVGAFAWNDALPRTPRLEEAADAPGVADRLRSFTELRGECVDVLHVNAPFEMSDLADVVVPVRADRLVVTCYDLIPLRFADVYLSDPAARARYMARLSLLNAADAVVTDSRAAADDVIELAGVGPRRVTVIGAGVGSPFVRPSSPLGERLKRLAATVPGIGARYVLVPTGIDWRKNIDGAIAAFGRLPERVRRGRRLVLACGLDDAQRAWIERLAAEAGCADQLVVTGHVSDEALVLLYQCAELVLFPSFSEGFGLPVLEARRCGARVISSNTSSLPEVLPEPRALFDPWDVDDITRHLEAGLTDPAFAAILDAVPDPAFTWSSTAHSLVEVYRDVAGPVATSARGSSTRPPRLGVVTVVPPTQSGVADHSDRLIRALHDEVDGVEVVAYASGAGPRPYPVRVTAALATDWAAGELDAVVYCVGNNRLHREAAALVGLVPGHVFLHDVRLPALAESGRPDRLGTVVAASLSVLVQSAHAVDLVAASTGATAVDIGPHPCEVVSDTAPLPESAGLPWVISAGIAHEAKRSDVVAAAIASLSRSGDARGALVGSGGERFATEGIVVTGEVAESEFDRWLRRAAVLVQLRRSSNGESSGVAAHAMARGVPLVVTDIGAMAELPDDAVVRVPVDIGPEELAATVRDLLGDAPRLAAMRNAGLAFAARETPAAQARRLVDAVFG